MKKLVFLSMMLIVTGFSIAQHPQSFDTLNPNKYFVDWWYTAWYADTTHCMGCPIRDYRLYQVGDQHHSTGSYAAIFGEHLQRHIAPKGELTVYGLAVAGNFFTGLQGRDENWQPIDDFGCEEYLKIYNADTSNTFHCLDSVRWHFTDPYDLLNIYTRGVSNGSRPTDSILIDCNLKWDHCNEQLPLNPFEECTANIPFFEYYFDRPVTVTDSFYVGFTCGNGLVIDSTNFYSSFYSYARVAKARTLDAFSYMNFHIYQTDDCPLMHPTLHKRIGYQLPNITFHYPTDHWVYEMRDEYLLVFPILTPPVPPDTDSFDCPRVENFRITSKGDDYAAFAWDTVDSQQQFRISVGPWDADPNSNPTYRCSQNPLYITSGLDTGRYYAAYIRPQCHHSCVVHDTTFWADWGDPLYFYLGNREPADGPYSAISQAAAPTSFALTPNPARDAVKITLTAPAANTDSQLILTDAAGRELLRHPVVGQHGLTLLLGGYPTGIYYVTLTGSQGSSTQKLVVE